ncbi:MAG: hypothetical protein AAGF35_08830, partial [Pseudomonadota bacterium]
MRIEILAGHDKRETVLSAPALLLLVAVLALWGSIWPRTAEAQDAAAADATKISAPKLPMQGIPPMRDTQVTRANYAEYPLSRWAFRNPGAVFNTVSIPREGDIWRFAGPAEPSLGAPTVTDAQAQQVSLDDLFEANYADGLLVVQGETLLHETYFSEFSPLDKHIWFSMTKSLVSAAFGILVEQGRV